MPSLNYFTCTLGEAAVLRREGSQHRDSFRTVIELIDEQSRKLPKLLAVGFARQSASDDNSTLPEQVTFRQLAELSIRAAIRLRDVLPSLGDAKSPERVGLVSNSNLDFILTWLALMRLGYETFLLAPQLELQAIEHLCSTSDVGSIIVDEAHHGKVSQLGDNVTIIKVPAYEGNRESDVDAPALSSPGATSATAYLRHTSGTSSGMPKPIIQSQWGAVGCLPVLALDDPPATFSTTPLYHGGLADCFRAWASGAGIWFFPEGRMPITGANILETVARARAASPAPVGYFSSVPYVLQMLAEESRGLRLLRSMELVGVGGAALPPAVGDRLVAADVRLVSRMGSAECGFLLSSHRDYAADRAWQYLRPPPADPALLAFEPRGGGLAELVVRPAWPLRAQVNRADGSYATADLFAPHASIPGAWRYHSRADAQITLANGKKFDPAPLEGAILASAEKHTLADVLLFGAGRDYAGALLFRARGAGLSDAEVREAVWPAVRGLNAGSPSHARLAKAMLVVLAGGDSALPKSSKGTILRRQAGERYKDAIEGAYSQRGTSGEGYRYVSDDEVLPTLARLAAEVLGRPVDADEDLYAQGVDSIACLQLRKTVEASLLPVGAAPLPLNVVYDSGTLRALAETLHRVRRGAPPSAADNDHDAAELRLMRELAAKYSAFAPVPPRPSSPPGSRGTVVVLTGATGGLGAHLLSQLVRDPAVTRIYCLVRGPCSQACASRVSEALAKRHLPAIASLSSSPTPEARVVVLASTLSAPNLGLRAADYARLAAEATVVVHAAWAVNFGLRLSSFAGQVAGTRELARLARVVFVSSTAAVAAAGAAIPEAPSRDPADAAPLGYARSKWVGERVACGSGADAVVVRVGQLCGDAATGTWNAREAFPLLLGTARVTGCLPELAGECLNWLPVDVAARAVLEIIAEPSASSSRTDGGGVRVYHVLNPYREPSWKQMLDWVNNTESARGPRFEVVPAAEWVDRLERALGSGEVAHPAQALLGMWKKRYRGEDAKGASTGELEEAQGRSPSKPTFATEQTGRVSATIRDVQPLEQQSVLKMWNWIQENC
ncbi:hypothetical protein F4780DRAFT_789299 [Xylariomycetidae sp. FL0641]|nr:hypothetical protein F4780DRAFT_789299 [Xylariomycetidae sp. FL0641]